MRFDVPLLDGVTARMVTTARTETCVFESGPADGDVVVFVHGNVSASRFFEETLLALPDGMRGLALDMRGYGRSRPDPIDATRGLRDFSDDVVAVLDALEIDHAHLVGWSVGGGVVMQVAIDHRERVRSLVLVASMSPFGFAGSKGLSGALCFDDAAGSGGGTANPDFARLLGEGERGTEHPMSPRNVMRQFYLKPPFAPPAEREEVYVTELLSTRIGDDHYPGDLAQSANWPTVGPGTRGMNNALSPKYCDLSPLADLDSPPPVLWIRGADDQIVSDSSMFDVGHLGALGAIPGWPGADVYPAQPMVGQLSALLSRLRERGGSVTEVVLEDCGHSPHVEKPQEFLAALMAHLRP